MSFVDDLDIIEAKYLVLALQERYLALEIQRNVIEDDQHDLAHSLEVAKQAYRKLLLAKGVN